MVETRRGAKRNEISKESPTSPRGRKKSQASRKPLVVRAEEEEDVTRKEAESVTEKVAEEAEDAENEKDEGMEGEDAEEDAEDAEDEEDEGLAEGEDENESEETLGSEETRSPVQSEDDGNGGENQSEREEQERVAEVNEETIAMKPARMYFPPTEYRKQIKLGTRCFMHEVLKTFGNLKPKLSNVEMAWFEEHPQFRHLFHMETEENHKVQGMWMLLLRNAVIEKKKEVWFIVNGIPLRYGLREHALISGLDCRNYPLGYKSFGNYNVMKRNFKGQKITLAEVKKRLQEMGPHKDRLKIAVLYFLASVICAKTKAGKGNLSPEVMDFFQRAVVDLDFCRTFPWGRYSYDYMLDNISHSMNHFRGRVTENAIWPLPGFCLPLELLAFEAIPILQEKFRESIEDADVNCPRMCQSIFKSTGLKGFPLSEIYSELGNTEDIESILMTNSEEEKALLDELMEEEEDVDRHDPIVESWMKRVGEGYTVVFEDMKEEDIAGRKQLAEQIAEQILPPDVEGSQCSHSTYLADVVKSINKSIKKMGGQLARVEKKVNKFTKEFEGRLAPVEAFVKEAQKGKRKQKE